jgi:hypothetical protein
MPRKTEVAVVNISEDASAVKLNVMTIQQAIDEARYDFRYFEQPKNQLKHLILGTEIDVPTGPVHQVFSYTINDVCEGRVPNAGLCPNKGPVVAEAGFSCSKCGQITCPNAMNKVSNLYSDYQINTLGRESS